MGSPVECRRSMEALSCSRPGRPVGQRELLDTPAPLKPVETHEASSQEVFLFPRFVVPASFLAFAQTASRAIEYGVVVTQCVDFLSMLTRGLIQD